MSKNEAEELNEAKNEQKLFMKLEELVFKKIEELIDKKMENLIDRQGQQQGHELVTESHVSLKKSLIDLTKNI